MTHPVLQQYNLRCKNCQGELELLDTDCFAADREGFFHLQCTECGQERIEYLYDESPEDVD